jgi:para-aminobenzoate synthetase component 1
MSAERRFRTLAGLPWCMWLDSAAADEHERFDILVADPYVTLRTRGAVTEIAPRGAAARESQRPPFELVREQLGDVGAAAPGLPFSGGAVGYFGYDLGRRLERIPAIAAADIAMPDLAIGLYDWAVVIDHAVQRTWLVGNGRDERTFVEWPRLSRGSPPSRRRRRRRFAHPAGLEPRPRRVRGRVSRRVRHSPRRLLS